MWPWIRLGDLNIPTFVLVQSLNACILLVWSRSRASRLGLPLNTALDFVFVCLAGGLVGGRLLHVFWEAPSYYAAHPSEAFNLLNGGYVYFGGLIIGTLIGCAFLRWRGELELARWFDFAAPLVCLGTAIGRVGCLFAGCCYGRVCSLPWAVSLLDEKGLWMPRHPTQIYESLWAVGTLLILLGLEAKPDGERPARLRRAGSIFATWMIFQGFGRFVIEFYRDDFRGPSLGLSISQWLSLALMILGIVWLSRRRSAMETV